MSSLLTRNFTAPARSPIPALRNRLIASFPGQALADFQDAVAVIQPLFQEVGRAYDMFLRTPSTGKGFAPVTINHRGPFESLVLAVPLYRVADKRASSELEIDAFIDLVTKASDGLTNLLLPKSWFGKRRSSSAVSAMPIIATLDKSRDEACKLASHYGSFFNNLPPYQRHLVIKIAGTQAAADELEDFAQFIGFPPPVNQVSYDSSVAVMMSLRGTECTIGMPSLPMTPQPEVVHDNIVEIANRFVGEFGGSFTHDEPTANKIILGWRNVLSKINLAPGDDEAREFFPYQRA